MSFINKDERITSCQTKTKHNFIETSVTASFLTFFFPSRLELFCSMAAETSLALTSRPHIRRFFLFFFFATKICIVYISVLPNCSELAFVLGFNVKFGLTCCSFSPALARPPVELLVLRKPTKSSCFLEDIRVPFDCKQQISTKH